MISAYYNEHDPYPAEWLRNLIAAGLIAPGDVDERDIRDVRPDDLRGYVQCHFFAGIAGWSYALRLAGWSDDRPVWTGSCPCQPFSVAGKGRGEADERHLWPTFRDLIAEWRPAVVFGEQVASKAGRAWLAAVRAEMEALGYGVGAADLCAAGVGAPHIRQRLWFVGVADPQRWPPERHRCEVANSARCVEGGKAERQRFRPDPRNGGVAGGLALPDSGECGGLTGCERSNGDGAQGGWQQGDRKPSSRGDASRLAYSDEQQRHGRWRPGSEGRAELTDSRRLGNAGSAGFSIRASDRHLQPEAMGSQSRQASFCASGMPHNDRSGAPDGFWRDADWLFCTDGKWRPVEPGTFPLADGLPGRVGQIRAYGNAIVPQVAKEFIEAVMECRP